MGEIGISPSGKEIDVAWAYEAGLISFEEKEEAIERKKTYDDPPSDDESWRRSIFD